MKKILFLVIAIATLSSCSSYSGMQSPSSRVEFNKNDLEFSEQVSATATTHRVFGIDWVSLFNSKNGDFTNSIITPSAIPFIDKTANKAVAEIVKTNPNYDVVFYPSVEKKTSGFPFIYSKTKATVKAKLARIKK